MTVKIPTKEDLKRAELVQAGVWVPPGQPVPVGAKGKAAAERRFGKK